MKKKLLLLAMGFALTTQMIIAQVPSYVPTNGLVGYWPFNGNANDISGYLNNGIVNGAALTTDRFGNANSAYSFNGTNNYIKVLSSASIQPANSISYSCWVYITTNYSSTFFTKNYGDGNNSYAFEKGNNTFGVTLKGIGGLQDNNSVNLNSWNFLMCTYDGTVLKFYLNGILVQSLNSNLLLTYTSNNLFLGVSNDPSLVVRYFSGKLDDIGIWNRALTQDEITSLYQSEVSCQSLVINSGTLSSFNPAVYQSTITIYPNPANDQITIDCGNLANVSGWNIKIFNTLSQEVFSGAMNQQKYTIPLNTWGGQGVYFVKIYDASNNLMNTKKIILQ
jgi:hypothetical protein